VAQLSAQSASVLIVDYSADERDMYAEVLRRSGFDIVEAISEEDAVIKAATATVIVTDLRLSRRESGLHLIRQLRQAARTRNTLIVVLTASVMQSDRFEALCAGCDAFVAKPCRPAELLTVIRYLVTVAPELRRKRAALRRQMQRRYARFLSEPTSIDRGRSIRRADDSDAA
jgi:CheY-like chemotaxis protein